MKDNELARQTQPLGCSDSEAPIDDGTYGWCEDTGEPIGLARLEAHPVTTLCVEAQERRELRERLTETDHDRH
jgi:DnaK suppressor protein